MEEQVQAFLFNPFIEKIISFFIGIAIIWMFIKTIQKNLLSKIKENDNRFRAKKIASATFHLVEAPEIKLIINEF